MPRTALITGASGRFGRNAILAMKAAGWEIRTHRRGHDLAEDARGADAIIAAWNPPYPRWTRDLPGLTAQLIAAAKASGARVVLPGNVYIYGTAPAPWTPATPHRPCAALGQARAEMEAALAAADIPLLTLRMGDFLDTVPSGNWFDLIIAKPLKRGYISYPGRPDAAHAWAYLPDATRAMAQLLEADLPHRAEVSIAGYTLTGAELAAALGATCRQMSWLPLQLARPVWPLARGLWQMRYLWDHPHWLEDGVNAALPGFRPTPLKGALAAATAHLR